MFGRKRKAAGTTAGGQFAAEAKSEPDVTLKPANKPELKVRNGGAPADQSLVNADSVAKLNNLLGVEAENRKAGLPLRKPKRATGPKNLTLPPPQPPARP